MANLERAIQIAHEAHDGQERRDGTPYVRHPLRVMGRLAAAGHSEATLIAAVLHDVPEDNDDWPVARLQEEEGFEEQIVAAVDRLDARGKEEDEYLKEIAKDKIALAIKIADMHDNLEDSPTPRQVEKYRRRLGKLARFAEEYAALADAA